MDASVTSSPQGGRKGPMESQPDSPESLSVKGVARHTFGLLLLLIVVLMWTASNFLGSSIFADASYAKPFFLTYLNTSVFIFTALPRVTKATYRRYRAGTLLSTARAALSSETLRTLSQETKSPGLSLESSAYTERGVFLNEDDRQTLPTTAASPSHALSQSLVEEGYLDLLPTARLAMTFCVLWFGANYFIMACLQYTTVASATILSSTSSVWTLLVGALSRIEKFTWRKLCGVLGSLLGVILISSLDMSSGPADESLLALDNRLGLAQASVRPFTGALANVYSFIRPSSTSAVAPQALNDFPDKSPSELILGDALALLSAIVYGFYTIALKKSTMSAAPRSLHMPTFFGLVGGFNMIFLFPLFPILHYSGVEPFAWPPTSHVWMVLLANALASSLSDILWAYAMVYTSPLVVTVGLSLTIPLSLVGEIILQGRCEGWMYWVGAMVVVGSFVFVEREEVKEEEEERRDESLSASLLMARSQGGGADEEAGLGGSSKRPYVQTRTLDQCDSSSSDDDDDYDDDGNDRDPYLDASRHASRTGYGTITTTSR